MDACIGVESCGTLFSAHTHIYALNILCSLTRGIDPGSVGEQEMKQNLSEEPSCCIALRTKKQKHYFEKTHEGEQMYK